MKVKGLTETLTNIDIAERQLERAISLFFEEKDYVSALTLAGAAEEILGKCLNQKGSPHWLDEITLGALKALGYTEENFNSSEVKKARKEIANISNYFKNRLKHFNGDESMTFTVDFYSAEMIDRAISNYWDLKNEYTEAMKRFSDKIIFGNKKA